MSLPYRTLARLVQAFKRGRLVPIYARDFYRAVIIACFQGAWQAMGLFMHSDSFKNCRAILGTAAGPLTRATVAEL